MNYFRALFYFMSLIGLSNAVYQRWLPDTNFENPANWNAKRAPCGNDVVIIPDESPVVYVQINTTIKELTLPKNGEIIFGQNSGLSFTDSASSSDTNCPDAGGDLEFTATQPRSWVDPQSWCRTLGSERGNCDTQTPLLDVEKIPCAFDDAVFPKFHSYYVDLSEQVPKLTVKSMRIAGQSLTSNTFVSYLTSDDGKRMFKTSSQSATSTSMTVTRKACTDMAGCACGNDQPEIAAKICTHVEKTCRRPRCKDTIQPVGACCKMCGAVFNITQGYGFDFGSFKYMVKNTFLTDPNAKNGVNVTMSITYQGWLQIAINDVTGEKSVALARKIKADLDKDLSNGGHKYAIDAVQLLFSTGNPLLPPAAHTGSRPMGGGEIAGIVIAVIIILIILALVVIIFVFRRTGRQIPINMPKMPSVNIPSLPRLPVRFRATARVPAQPQTAAHIDPGFANPLYDTSPFDDGNQVVKEMELITSPEVQPTFDATGAGFNNPLYGAQGFSDPTKTEQEQEKEKEKESSPSTPTPIETSPTTGVLIDFKKETSDDSTI